MARHLHLLMSICVLGIATPSLAQAGKKVVVLEFEGASHKAARATVEAELGKAHTVVPHAKVASESKKLGIGLQCNETNIMGMASIFGAEGVFCGRIDKGKLEISVYNGGDGKLVKTFKVKATFSARSIKKIRKAANAALAKTWNWDTVKDDKGAKPAKKDPVPLPEPTPDPGTDALGKAIDKPTHPEPVQEPDPDPEPEPVVAGVADTEDPLARSKKQRRRRRGRRATVKKKSAPTGRVEGRHALRLATGPSFLFSRNFRFYPNCQPPCDITGIDKNTSNTLQTGWQTSPVGGIAVDAELYPGAWLTKGFGGNVGLGVSYARYFGLSWRMAGDPDSHTATHQTIAVDLRARYQILDRPWLPLVFLMFGFQYSEFSMNDGAKDAMFSDVAYSGLDIGAGGEVGLVPRWLHFSAWFHYYPVLSRGEITKSDEWGAGTGGGWNLGGALRGKLWGPLGWRFEFEYTSYVVNFKNLPEESGMVKGNAYKARDRYITGLLFVSFVN